MFVHPARVWIGGGGGEGGGGNLCFSDMLQFVLSETNFSWHESNLVLFSDENVNFR